MAKVKYTENGNVKVTMTHEQFVLVQAILGHVRLGMRGNADLIANLTEAMSEFASEPDYDVISFTTDDEFGNKITIEDVTIETD